MGKRGNGEGSIYYSEKLKRWIGQYTYNGKRKSIYGKTRSEVKDKLTQSLFDIGANKYVDKSNYTLMYMVNKYNEDDFNANLIAEVTYLRRKETANIINKLPISSLPIQKITSRDINDNLLNICDYSNSTIDKVYCMIKAAYNKAMTLNIINNNPFLIKNLIIKPKSTKLDKKVDALTIDEQKLLVQELNSHNYKYKDIILIALYSGMRIGEILALKKQDIDLENNIIHIQRTLTKDTVGKVKMGIKTKTYSGSRDIPITSLFRNNIINSLNNSEDLLFTYEGNLLSPNVINSHVVRVCKNAGIRVVNTKKKKSNDKIVNLKLSETNTHMLRHTYATRCIESGMTAVVLQRLLGHKDISVTLNTYTSVFNKYKEDEIQKYLDYINQLH